MALHDDLLEQAEHLARREKQRPKQASLRRAVSSAYYALFHLLVDAGTRFVATRGREPLRRQLARNFDHGLMKSASQAFASANKGHAWVQALEGPPSGDLVDVAWAFVVLQEARHAADYDIGRSFTRAESTSFVVRAQDAFAAWGRVAGTDEAATYLVALLIRWRS